MLTNKEFIESRIERITESGCWIWLNCVDSGGYGSFRRKFRGKTQRAHTASYEAFVAPIPTGMLVCHRCDVRSCCNPEHLFIGTRQDNINDAANKGRLKGITRNRPSGLIYKKRQKND